MRGVDRRFHEHALKKLQLDAEIMTDVIEIRVRELADDDFDGAEDCRARLAEALAALETVAGSLERAWQQLPAVSA